MSGGIRAALLCLGLLVSTGVSAQSVTEDAHHRAMLDIAGQLRCAVCQNQSVAESHAQLAADMRALIEERLAAGESAQQVLAYFRARYGDYVLMRPPVERSTVALWWLPPALLGLALLGAAAYLRRQAGRA